jgi:hypothetical protein
MLNGKPYTASSLGGQRGNMSNPTRLELVNEPRESAAQGSRETGIMESLVKIWTARRIGQGDTETEIVAALEACELAEIENIIQKPVDDVREDCRERFLRNMAFVALTARLTRALRNMARSAESFCKRKKQYGYHGMKEFDRLRLEYTERFGIAFSADRITFVETMREVRNRIVHDGPEDGGRLDVAFSKEYPEYVSGSGIGAQVSVSEAQLAEAVKNSIDLVGWLAGQLRKKELEAIKRKPSTETNL